jgi:glutathione S-transferase
MLGEKLRPRESGVKLYYFPSPNPQKIMFALLELGLEFEPVPVDLKSASSARRGSSR